MADAASTDDLGGIKQKTNLNRILEKIEGQGRPSVDDASQVDPAERIPVALAKAETSVLQSEPPIGVGRSPENLQKPPKFGGFLKMRPPNLGGEPAKITCFKVILGAHS